MGGRASERASERGREGELYQERVSKRGVLCAHRMIAGWRQQWLVGERLRFCDSTFLAQLPGSS